MASLNAPPHPSGFTSDKPILSHITVDLLVAVFSHTFLNPGLAWLVPLALRAQSFHYQHPPMYWSIIYATAITILFLARHLDHRFAFGNPRKFDWTEEVVLITGGASGLGLLVAEVYGMRGVSVAILDVKEPDGSGEARNISFYKCDVGDPAQVEKVKKQVEEELGKVTVLINNAGVVNGKSVLELSDEEIERSFKTNVMSHFHTVRAFLPGMIADGKGTIVTLSSILAHIGPAHLSDYSATKAASRSFHQSLTAELKPHPGVKTLLVAPGQMATSMFDGLETPNSCFAPVLQPVDVAKEIIKAVDQGEGGELSMPLFGRWIAIMNIVPPGVNRALRWVSGIDKAMEGFRESRMRQKKDE